MKDHKETLDDGVFSFFMSFMI